MSIGFLTLQVIRIQLLNSGKLLLHQEVRVMCQFIDIHLERTNMSQGIIYLITRVKARPFSTSHDSPQPVLTHTAEGYHDSCMHRLLTRVLSKKYSNAPIIMREDLAQGNGQGWEILLNSVL